MANHRAKQQRKRASGVVHHARAFGGGGASQPPSSGATAVTAARARPPPPGRPALSPELLERHATAEAKKHRESLLAGDVDEFFPAPPSDGDGGSAWRRRPDAPARLARQSRAAQSRLSARLERERASLRVSIRKFRPGLGGPSPAKPPPAIPADAVHAQYYQAQMASAAKRLSGLFFHAGCVKRVQKKASATVALCVAGVRPPCGASWPSTASRRRRSAPSRPRASSSASRARVRAAAEEGRGHGPPLGSMVGLKEKLGIKVKEQRAWKQLMAARGDVEAKEAKALEATAVEAVRLGRRMEAHDPLAPLGSAPGHCPGTTVQRPGRNAFSM
ncbi:hypothetical protein SO694_00207019 [Aureococcus anophagefferens]|uniref:Uncharacterized protein n=1 Tax=Aureococcus anophagefferens TaxID=44056 RepID=A0ABR1FNR2_AURAN